MELKMFSIYDDKVASFVRPFFLQNEATAIRSIADSAREPDHPFRLHPGDYILYELGTFDESNGKVETFDQPVRIKTVAELMFPIETAIPQEA